MIRTAWPERVCLHGSFRPCGKGSWGILVLFVRLHQIVLPLLTEIRNPARNMSLRAARSSQARAGKFPLRGSGLVPISMQPDQQGLNNPFNRLDRELRLQTRPTSSI